MTFAAWPALLIALGVVLPYLAHRYRRRDQKVVRFAPTAFIEPLAAETRAPSSLEERPLFYLRALLVAAVALLGASPWVRCEGHSLERTNGGSIAIVLVMDDSYSMFAREGGKTHFDAAREKAFGIVDSLEPGDSVAIVRAAGKTEISLASTMNREEAREILRTFEPTAGGADLDGAMSAANTLLHACPQKNRTVYVLSDRIEEEKKNIAVPEDPSIRVEFPLAKFTAISDCALLSATRLGPRVNVTGQCSPAVGNAGLPERELILRGPKGKVGSTTVRGASFNADIPIPAGSDVAEWMVEFASPDAIPESDRLEVVTNERSNEVVLFISNENEMKSPMEGAWAALQSPIELRRSATLSEASFEGALGVIMDDPLPFSPDERVQWQSFADKGGAAMLWLGARSATPVLGSSFSPLFDGVVAWRTEKRERVQSTSRSGLALDLLGLGYRDVSTSGYAELLGAASLQSLLVWEPSVPLLLQGSRAWVVTVPLDQANSDVTLRPAFLELVNRWADDLAHRGSRRGEKNVWELEVPTVLQKPSGARTGEALAHRATAPGTYTFLEKGKVRRKENVSPDPKEITQNVREIPTSRGAGSKEAGALPRDISWAVALVVLFLVTLESLLRTQVRRVGA